MRMADDFTRHVFQRQQLILADRQLTASAKVVGLHLLEYVNRGTKDARPSQGRLAKCLGLCRRTVQNGLYRLAERSHFKVDINRGRGCTNRYHPIPTAEELKLAAMR